MPQTIADIMTRDPVTCPRTTPIEEAARLMRDRDIGDVIVADDAGTVCGIVTDRDLVVRGLAEGSRDLSRITLADVCSADPVMVSPTVSVGDAVGLMRERAIRRLPVVEGGRAVGVVSLGDLAVERDPASALADISAEEPNR